MKFECKTLMEIKRLFLIDFVSSGIGGGSLNDSAQFDERNDNGAMFVFCLRELN